MNAKTSCLMICLASAAVPGSTTHRLQPFSPIIIPPEIGIELLQDMPPGRLLFAGRVCLVSTAGSCAGPEVRPYETCLVSSAGCGLKDVRAMPLPPGVFPDMSGIESRRLEPSR